MPRLPVQDGSPRIRRPRHQPAALIPLKSHPAPAPTNVSAADQQGHTLAYSFRSIAFDYARAAIGLGLSILSYRGQVHFGLISDARLIPDPDGVIRRFGAEFDKLLYLAMMGNWDVPLDAAAATALLEDATAA